MSDDPRTTLLKLRSVLHDRVTGLPAFPLLLDDLRALLDERRALGLIHVCAPNLPMVESLYGWQTFDRVLARMAQVLDGKRSELPEGTLLAVDRVAGGEFLLFLAEQADPAELERVGSELRESLEQVFREEEFAGLNPSLEPSCGHAQLTINPYYRFERRIYAAIDEARTREARRGGRRERSKKRELRRIIDEADLSTVYQPVVELQSRRVVGYEALVRGPKDSALEMPHALFAVSRQLGTDVDLDRICRRTALRGPPAIGRGGKLFLNLRPASLDDPGWEQESRAVLGGDREVVLEISERDGDGDADRFTAATQRLKQIGYRLALDDVGTGYASLSTLDRIRPDYLKVDPTLVRGVGDSRIKQEVIGSLLQIADSIGAGVIAEGVEHEDEAVWLRDAGAGYGQGYLFASPQPASNFDRGEG